MPPKIPRRIRLNNEWYEVHEGMWSSLNLKKWMGPIEYTLKEPFAHISNLYYIYDLYDNKIGELDMNNNTYSACITEIEI